MNKQDLIHKIKQLEGISNDERAYLIDLVNTKKKYGLVWEDKPEDVEEQLRENLPVLREVVEKRILSSNLPKPDIKPTKPTDASLFDSQNPEDISSEGEVRLLSEVEAPNHILIEGDNLHALTALTFTHEGQIDVMYFDPPYNTGNKDFKYNDSFVDKEDSYRHSKWLSFMHKRLLIAKRLLSDKGVIFISIDDNEQAQLKMLCDDIFSESNFIGNFIWVKKKKGSHLSRTLRSMTEYVICYSKSISNIELFGEEAYTDKWQPLVKRTNSIKEMIFPPLTLTTTLKEGVYFSNRYGKGTSSILINNDFTVKNGVIQESIIVVAPFVWTQKKLDEEIELGSSISLSSQFGFNTLRHNQGEKIKRPSTLINSDIGVGTNEDAYQELIDLFSQEGVMTYPKPTSLIKYLINALTFFNKSENPIILDFFAGTGTTLHATMQLNAEDGGNRQCILVTNNENNICEEVTYVRNKRVIEGYTNTKGIEVAGLANNNLRYYKSEFVPSSKTEQNKRLLTQTSTELLCIKEDCYNDITEIYGFNTNHCRIFKNESDKYLVIVYHSRQINVVCEMLIEFINTIATTQKVKLYAFSPEKETLLEDFCEVADKVDAVPLPEAIYNAYRATFKTIKLDKKPMSEIIFSDESNDETIQLINQDNE